jgi:hypothetical protein
LVDFQKPKGIIYTIYSCTHHEVAGSSTRFVELESLVNNPCRAATNIHCIEKGGVGADFMSHPPICHRLSYTENAAVPVRIEISLRQHQVSLAVGVDFMLVSVPSFWCTKNVSSASETAVVNYQYLLGSTDGFMALSATLDSRALRILAMPVETPLLRQRSGETRMLDSRCYQQISHINQECNGTIEREHVWLMMSSQLPRHSR